MMNPQDMRILIVDDEHTMCNIIRGMLKLSGYGKKYFFAPNGLLALNILKSNTIDLAIIDWNMPVMNGMDLLRSIRSSKDYKNLPVVMVTGESNREIVAEALEAEVDDYIIKPLTANSLELKLSSLLDKVNASPNMYDHLLKAQYYQEKGDLDAAIEEILLAKSANPLSSRPVRELGYCYYKKNDLSQAETWLKRAIYLNRLDFLAIHYLGELYLKQNEIEKSIRFFFKAMDISPRHLSRSINFGKLLVKKNMWDKAERVFNKALLVAVDPQAVCEEIVEYCYENEMLNYAIKLMESMLKQTPDRSDLLLRLGNVNEKLGNHITALNYLIQARNREKDNTEIMLHIAHNYLKIGQVPKSNKIVQSVLKLEPKNLKAKKLLSAIGA